MSTWCGSRYPFCLSSSSSAAVGLIELAGLLPTRRVVGFFVERLRREGWRGSSTVVDRVPTACFTRGPCVRLDPDRRDGRVSGCPGTFGRAHVRDWREPRRGRAVDL